MIRGVRSPLVLLHGFAGTRHSWEPVIARLDGERYRPVALDLRGHGRAAHARPVTFAACVGDVLAATAGRFSLCGYSMGGRLALHVALAAPERVARLVLLSATGGIADAGERAERARADAALAADLERGTIESFADRWTAQPLFAGTPPAARRAWREDVRRNRPQGLAAALRGVGTGAMEPLWDRLGRLELSVTVAAGARDSRYVALARRLADALPRAELVLVPDAGHGLPREAPGAVARLLGAGVEA
jgi:2-succinyl-6-hydroxy-2,4-cyclohexadiene-1-carboxylate synthase